MLINIQFLEEFYIILMFWDGTCRQFESSSLCECVFHTLLSYTVTDLSPVCFVRYSITILVCGYLKPL